MSDTAIKPTSEESNTSTEVARWTPWPQIGPWGSNVAQLLDNLWHLPTRNTDQPAAELRETEDSYVLTLELPGVQRKNVTVDVSGRRVRAKASRVEQEHKGTVRHSTRSAGTFDFEITLPEQVKESEVSASMDHGVLTVTLPKTAPTTPTHVKIS